MKNKPFSIVVVAASAVACVLMYIFLHVFGGMHDIFQLVLGDRHQTFGTFILLLGAACLPCMILSAIAIAANFSKHANWLFCISSIVVIGLGVSGVGYYAFDGGNMQGVALVFVLLFQFVALLVPLFFICLAKIIAYVLQKRRQDA